MNSHSITLPIRVVAFETDYGGVVSNTRYLEYIERARYHLIHSLGLTTEGVWKSHGVQPVVRRVEVDYLGFARHEDALEMRCECVELSGASVVLSYELKRVGDEIVLMRARQTLAFLNTNWRSVRVPQIYREKLS